MSGHMVSGSMKRLVPWWLAVALCLLALTPLPARADSYSIDQVDIDATVQTDGSLDVEESREFDFDGDFHGVYWKLPKGSYGGRDVDVEINGVGEIVDGSYVEFQEDYSGENHTYELSDEGSYVRVKLYSAHEDERATFVINYTDTALATRHEDVSELYWKFVSDGWDEESRNVTCTVHLPVPAGKKVEPEENVRAWGHGPLDASVHFVDDDIVYSVPGVGGSEFAEARITFPAEWLSAATSQGDRALPGILAEEQEWADEANARRERARALTYGGSAVSLLATLAMMAGSIITLIRYKNSHRPQFDDKYFRDVPSNDHPAVLGALYRGGSPSDEDFTATLMNLTDLKAIKLELVTLKSKGLFGHEKSVQDYRLTCPPSTADMNLSAIDRKALNTLFNTIGRFGPNHVSGDDGTETMVFSDLETVAKKHPEAFHNAYEGWEVVVQAEMARRGFSKDDSKTGRGIAIACILGSIVLFMATVFLLLLTESWMTCVPLILLQVASCALAVYATVRCEGVSREAIEIKAKLKALRNWLRDFTRLDEAVPRDVVLWNRLLVMAVVLGVADEVVKQLKVAVPELFNDPMLTPAYAWYYAGPSGRAYNSFSNAYESAHSVSASKLAASESSSGGGGGGGFSGGGGGGFGGGGGGGAF